jgi:uncharacterized alkaline shock family protein YloU
MAEEDHGSRPEADSSSTVRIADEVVSTVAAMAAMEVDGVAGMAAGLVGGLTEMLGRRGARGVRVEVQGQAATLELSLTVRYGVRIPEVAAKVQENVRRAVEQMTGLQVKAVHVHVTGVEADRRLSAGEGTAGP